MTGGKVEQPYITVDAIRDPANRDAALEALRLAARLDPAWFAELIRREARISGTYRVGI